MSSSALNQLLAALNVQANVFHNGQYCGLWAVDTSGSDWMNFHIVTKGQCVIKVDEQQFHLSEGDAVFMPSDAKHRISASETDTVQTNQSISLLMSDEVDGSATGLVCGHFTHNHPIFSRLVAQLPSVIVVRHASNCTGAQIVQLIIDESILVDQTHCFILNRLSDALFYTLLRDNLNTSDGLLAAMTHPKLSKSLATIHASVDANLSIDDLAQNAGMSRSAFSALFKQIVGQSPAQYSIQWKMTLAYRWLADDGISTFDASLRCGYESEASFSKAFKRTMGIGPGKARQNKAMNLTTGQVIESVS